MRRKKSLLIPAVLAFSLCTGAVVPVLAEETSQTADAADNEQPASGSGGACRQKSNLCA